MPWKCCIDTIPATRMFPFGGTRSGEIQLIRKVVMERDYKLSPLSLRECYPERRNGNWYLVVLGLNPRGETGRSKATERDEGEFGVL